MNVQQLVLNQQIPVVEAIHQLQQQRRRSARRPSSDVSATIDEGTQEAEENEMVPFPGSKQHQQQQQQQQQQRASNGDTSPSVVSSYLDDSCHHLSAMAAAAAATQVTGAANSSADSGEAICGQAPRVSSADIHLVMDEYGIDIDDIDNDNDNKDTEDGVNEDDDEDGGILEEEESELITCTLQRLPLKDFGAEVRPAVDIAQFLQQSVLLLDVTENSPSDLVDLLLAKMVPSAMAEEAKMILFTHDTGIQSRITGFHQ